MATHVIVTLLLTILITSSPPVGGLAPQVNYVHPLKGSISCKSEPCTFDQYAHDPEHYFLPNTTFSFLPGDHQLSNSLHLQNVSNVAFQGMSMEAKSVTIRLAPQVGLSFANCDNIEIRSLKFLLSDDFEYGLMFSDTNSAKLHNIILSMEDENSTGCSAIISQASEMSISDSSFVGISGQFGTALSALDSSDITFTGSNNFSDNTAKLGGAIHSIGSTLQFTEIASFINNTAISNKNDTLYFDYITSDSSNDTGIGGAIFAESSYVIISGCAEFVGNSATYAGGAIAVVNCSTLVIDGSSCFNKLHIHPTTVLFNGNCVTLTRASEFSSDFDTLGSGGAIFTYDCVVNITNTSLANNFSPGFGGAAQFIQSNITLYNINAVNNIGDFSGGAIRINSSEQVLIDGNNYFGNNSAKGFGGAIQMYMVQFLQISGKNTFVGNQAECGGGALGIYRGTISFVCGDNVFKRNFAVYYGGGAIYSYNTSVHFCGSNKFTEGVARSEGGALYIEASTTLFNGTHTNMILFSSNIAMFGGGAVSSRDSQIELYGMIQFYNNTATKGHGGAMALYGTSRMILNMLTVIDFSENRAHCDGGALYLSEDYFPCYVATDAKLECLIILKTTDSLLNNASILLNFTNNMANRNGDVLYGGQLGKCKLLFNTTTAINTTSGNTMEVQDNSYEIVMNISTIDGDSEQGNNSIASPPLKLCLCDNSTSNFNKLHTDRCVAPGQAFEIAMVVQDLYNSTLQGIAIGHYNYDDSYPLTPKDDIIMYTSLLCKTFTYRLFVDSELIETTPYYSFYISEEDSCNPNEISLTITILPCPIGFDFSSEVRKCVCTDILQKFTENCNIDYQSVNRSRNNFWINITTDYFLIYEGSCPLDYCYDNTYKVVTIKPNKSDVQCLDGRTGKICGSCKQHENYSLALGSLRCHKNCSDFSPLWIILFGILGILLITLLFLLRLTVSAGTINGMIFYANIVQANHQIFLPKVSTDIKSASDFLNNFFIIFISWLNLDFGIHTCFYGMNIYIYSWLQFCFPIYLWILMVIIIVSAHYSRRVAKRLGQNPVAVLATVLLISYGKMLKAIIVPLSWASLKNVTQSESNISNERVWLYNGDVEYLHKPDHFILVMFAILVLVFLFLPYTLFLLCGRYLQIKSHWRILSWINKLKPFMDAYYAPFKRGQSYWLGLFLLARCGLFLNVAFTPDYAINLTIVTSVIAGLAIIKGRIYEKWYNDFLESSFLLNLCTLSIVTFYVQSEKSSDPHKVMELQNILSSVSVGLAFLCFIGIMIFHTYRRKKELKLFLDQFGNCKSYSLKKKSGENAYSEQSLEIISNSTVNLRELLLDDDS